MATIVTRAGKGSPLTHNEVDANFNNLNTDKVETSSVSAFGATLIDDADAATARTTLGLGTAATTASTDYATAAQGALADSAVQPNDSPSFGSITVTGTVDGRDVAADGTKLDGIEAGADITDTANVTAAGALMDSELTSEASVKALNQGVATTDSPSFAGLTVDTNTLYVDSTNNRVGVGTASPSTTLHVTQVGDTVLTVKAQSSGAGNDDDAFINLDTTETGEAAVQFYQDGILKAFIDWYSEGGPDLNIGTVAGSGANIDLQTEGAVAMRIDSSGDVWINGNNSTTDTRVLRVQSEGYAVVKINGDLSNSAGEPGGSALQLALDGTGIKGVVSYINSADDSGYGTTYTGTLVNSMLVGTTGSQALFFGINSAAVLRVGATYLQPVTDNVFDLGQPANRYDDVYATNGTIQTSDASEKQDIAELDEAEKRVAVAAKGLIRKYRWKDAVAEKGDAARIHVGIIAQDLQAAFAAEGLDAGRYAMFISSTWWEHEGQTYETAEEAPEGATERTRLGVRYPELLAFIIGAL